MGNYLSTQQSEVHQILTRLNRLEGLDKNNDGFVSKEEYLEWKKRRLQSIYDLKLMIRLES